MALIYVDQCPGLLSSSYLVPNPVATDKATFPALCERVVCPAVDSVLCQVNFVVCYCDNLAKSVAGFKLYRCVRPALLLKVCFIIALYQLMRFIELRVILAIASDKCYKLHFSYVLLFLVLLTVLSLLSATDLSDMINVDPIEVLQKGID